MNRYFLILYFLLSTYFSQFHASAEDVSKKELKDKIINAWLKNSAKIDSYRLKYELKTTYHKGMANYYYRLKKTTGYDPLPENTITTKQSCEFIASKDNLKNINFGNEFNFYSNKILRNADLRIYNNKHHFIFVYNPFFKQFPFASFDSKNKQNFIMNYKTWLPLKLCTKPFSQEYRDNSIPFNLIEFEITKRNSSKSNLIEITVPATKQYILETQILIDPDQNYMPVKYTEIYKNPDPNHNKKSYEWNISDWKKIDNILIPAAFTYKEITPTGKIIQTVQCKLTYSELNKPIPDHEFKMEIPVGTQVKDNVNNEYYVLQKNMIKRDYPKDLFLYKNRAKTERFYKILMNPKYNHLKTVEEIDNILNRSREK